MKAKVKLTFHTWKIENSTPPLELAGTEKGQSTGSPAIKGAIDLPLEDLYQYLREQQEHGKHGLFVLEICD